MAAADLTVQDEGVCNASSCTATRCGTGPSKHVAAVHPVLTAPHYDATVTRIPCSSFRGRICPGLLTMRGQEAAMCKGSLVHHQHCGVAAELLGNATTRQVQRCACLNAAFPVAHCNFTRDAKLLSSFNEGTWGDIPDSRTAQPAHSRSACATHTTSGQSCTPWQTSTLTLRCCLPHQLQRRYSRCPSTRHCTYVRPAYSAAASWGCCCGARSLPAERNRLPAENTLQACPPEVTAHIQAFVVAIQHVHCTALLARLLVKVSQQTHNACAERKGGSRQAAYVLWVHAGPASRASGTAHTWSSSVWFAI